jgi:uncharacterized membrane protein YwzB
VLGVIGYFSHVGKLWSKNYGIGDLQGFKFEMLMESLDTTKLALICVVVSVVMSSIISYFLKRKIRNERNKIMQTKSLRSRFIEKMLEDLGKELTAALE